MSKRPILMVTQNEVLAKFDLAFRESREVRNKKVDAFKEQAQKVMEEFNTFRKAAWADFEEYLASNNLLPEYYDPDKHNLRVQEGVLYVEDKEEARSKEKNQIFKELLQTILED